MFKGRVLLLGVILFWSVVVECHSTTTTTNRSRRYVPTPKAFSDDYLPLLRTPPGFRVNVFARGQGNARMMLTLPDGTVLLTRFDVGEVVALRDHNGDGVADESPVIVRVPDVHGLALHSGTVYLASARKLYAMPMLLDGTFGTPREFAQLPEGGLHPRRTIGTDDAGRIYVSVGSWCNSCAEFDPEHATLMRMNSDGSERTIFARGLRDMVGFGWHPATRQLWGMDNGSDDRGDNIPPEELNLIEEGRDYGWPGCFGRRQLDKVTAEEVGSYNCAGTTPMVRGYTAHAAPVGFVFYNGNQFPRAYEHNAFVAFHGSWNRGNPKGYKVVRVRFKNGRPMGFQDFVSGWLFENNTAQFGRPAGLTVAADGALLISDDVNGVIYRVSYSRAGR
jgi:glucose/arabinose dehydrogenase